MNTQTPAQVPQTDPHADPCAITGLLLRVAVPELQPDQAEIHAQALEAARPIAELNTTRRVRHFLAQCGHESGGFTRLVESLRYSDPVRLDALFSAVRDVHHARALMVGGPEAIANCVYAGRCGNGDSRSFDGWNYRGRGYLQVTFRDNYRQIGELIGQPLEKQPDLLSQPAIAAQAAAAFWKLRGINRQADRDDTRAVTACINPALAGLDQRIAWSGRFRPVYP